VVSVITKVTFGKDQEVKEFLEAFPVSKSVSISFMEKKNLTLRQRTMRLGRKKTMDSPNTSPDKRLRSTCSYDIITLSKSISVLFENTKTIPKMASENPIYISCYHGSHLE